MTNTQEAHRIGKDLFGESYIVTHREFTDGDTRTIVEHNYGWSATNYVTAKVWLEGDVWIEYYEGDTMRERTIVSQDEFNPEQLLSHIYPSDPQE